MQNNEEHQPEVEGRRMTVEVKLSDIQPGPVLYERLDPLGEAWARNLYERVGHFLVPTFEAWELGFMRDINYLSEIVLWEAIARAYEAYLGEHPDCDRSRVVRELAQVTMQPAQSGERAGLRDLFLKELEAMSEEDCPKSAAELPAYLSRRSKS